MSRVQAYKLLLLFSLLAIPAAVMAVNEYELTDTVSQDTTVIEGEKKSGNFINRIISYFEKSNKTQITRRPSISFVGGPYYSSDTKFGIGLIAAGIYSTNPEDTTLQPSSINLFGNATTAKYFKVGVRGMHLYRKGNRRIDYEVSYKSYRTYFWGVGYDMARSDMNKCKYLLTDVLAEVDHLWRLYGPFYAGPLLKFDYISARDIQQERQRTWYTIPHHTTSLGAGVKLQFDTRDNYTAPTSGWLGELTQRFYPRFMGNSSTSFSSTEVAVNSYTGVWRGGVIACRLHGNFTYGNTPWGLMPTVGGSGPMRGYYEGQYRDKCEMDATVELRQHVYGRSGVAVWCGCAAVFPGFNNFKGRYLLPNYGAGYRWEFKKLTNIRVDVGFGKGCWGIEFSINEAF